MTDRYALMICLLYLATRLVICEMKHDFHFVKYIVSLQNADFISSHTMSLDEKYQSSWYELHLGVIEGCSKLYNYLYSFKLKILWNVSTYI